MKPHLYLVMLKASRNKCDLSDRRNDWRELMLWTPGDRKWPNCGDHTQKTLFCRTVFLSVVRQPLLPYLYPGAVLGLGVWGPVGWPQFQIGGGHMPTGRVARQLHWYWVLSYDEVSSAYVSIVSEWVEFNAPLDTIQVISEAERQSIVPVVKY